MPDDDKGQGNNKSDTGTVDWQAEVDKWKALARKHEEQAKTNFAELNKLKAQSDASKSDTDKIMQKLAEMEERAKKAERKALIAEIARDKGLTREQASRLRGDTQAELEADADELIATFGLKKSSDDKGSVGDDKSGSASGDDKSPPAGGDAKAANLGRPKENLRPGATPPGDASSGDFDVKKVLDAIPRL